MSHHASNTTLKRSIRRLLGSGMALSGAALSATAMAGPTGEDVIRGAADVTRPDTNRTIIDQHTQRAVINWQTFNVDADEYVMFNQLNSSSVVLNRVIGGDASYILGQMQANGQVFLLNAQGVFFGAGASIDVQGFLGSTLDMDPDAFMNGNYALTRNPDSPANAGVINHGQITAGPGGYVVLAGDYAENTGIIAANAGTVALVSGNALTLDIDGDGLVNFAVNEATFSEAAGVKNAGSLIADGGRVIMTARVANDLVATAVNNEGLVRARSIEERNGEIYLVGHGGDVVNSGTLDADGENANGGGIGIYSDRNVTLADGGIQTAAGDDNHKGGVIRAIAEDHLDYQRDNLIRVTGGTSGGFVEVSGHGSINLRGVPQIGAGGTFLIDPANMFLQDGSGSPALTMGSYGDAVVGINYLTDQLNSGADVLLVASNQIAYTGGGGAINVTTGDANLSMIIGSISTGASACNFGICVSGAPVAIANGAGTITLTGLDINIGGNIDLQARNITTSTLEASGDILVGNVLNPAGMVTVNGNINAGGNIEIRTDDISGDGISITGSVSGNDILLHAFGSSGASANISVNGTINAAGNVDMFVSSSAFGGNISIGGINANGAVSLSAIGNDDSFGHITVGTGTPGATFDGGDIISATGNITLTATGTYNGGIISVGKLHAGGDITLTADGDGSSGGQILVGNFSGGDFSGGEITAGNSITLEALGEYDARIEAGNITGGGETVLTADAVVNSVERGNATIRVGDVNVTSGDVYIEALGDSAGAGVLQAGNVYGTGLVLLQANSAFNNANASASVDVASAGAGGNLYVDAVARIGTANLSLGGVTGANSLTVNHIGANGSLMLDNITGVMGSADFTLDMGGDVGHIDIGGDLTIWAQAGIDFVGNFDVGNDFYIEATAVNALADLNVGGNLEIWAPNVTIDGANAGGEIYISATQIETGSLHGSNMMIAASQPGGQITINGNVTADNRATFLNLSSGSGIEINGDVKASRVWLHTDGSITVGNVQALGSLGSLFVFDRGDVWLDANGNIEAGSIQAVNDLAGARIRVETGIGDIAINGDVTATGADPNGGSGGVTGVRINNSGSGSVLVDGNIVAEGYPGSNDGFSVVGAEVNLYGNNNISVTGGIDITAHAVSYAAGSIDAGFGGHAALNAYTNGGDIVIGGPINVTATGEAFVYVYGNNVTTGNIAATANPESLAGSFTSFGGDGEIFDVSAGGLAGIIIQTGGFGGSGSITVGNLSANGPNAVIALKDAMTITTGAITLNASGGNAEYSFSADYGGTIVGRENVQGGFAELIIGQSSYGGGAGNIDINGAINVNAAGRGTVALLADNIATRSINVNATAGTFMREGETGYGRYGNNSWPFGAELGAPRIDTGVITGGAAQLIIAGNGSGSNMPMAGNVEIAGNLSVNAPGEASVQIFGDDVAISGTINANATAAEIDGEFDYFDFLSGFSYQGTVVATTGMAQVEIRGLDDANHAVTIGDAITLSGPRTRFNIEGGNVTLADVSITASGAAVEVHETESSDGIVLGEIQFEGDLLTGTGMVASGALIAGNIEVQGRGAVGIILSGNTIDLQSVSVTATAGQFTTTHPDYNGGVETTTQTGAAMLGIESPAVANISGDVTVTGALSAHVGGEADIAGDFSVTGGEVLGALPAYVEFLNQLEDENPEPVTLAPLAITAANVAANATDGNLGLGTAQIAATGTMTLAASGAVNLSGRTLNAGGFDITAGRAINLSGANLTATNHFEAVAATTMNAASATIDATTIRLEAGTNMSVSNISLDADQVALIAGGNITNSSPPGTITAGALAVLAGGNINLGSTTLVVGDGRISSVPGDALFLELLAREGIATPSGGPNLVMRGQSIVLNGGSLAGDYVYLETDSLAVNGTFNSSNPNLLLQVAPLGAGAGFSLEQSNAGSGDAAYIYNGMLDRFGAATIALGTTGHTGNVGISNNSANVNIGDTNLFVLTSGDVSGLSRVLSTGVVKDLRMLLGGDFKQPQTDEIDINRDVIQTLNNEYRLQRPGRGDEEEEGDEEGEDTNSDTDMDEDEDSLIRQETADEEMMCR